MLAGKSLRNCLFSISILIFCTFSAVANEHSSISANNDRNANDSSVAALYSGHMFTVLLSETQQFEIQKNIQSAYLGMPFTGDFDGDGFTDLAVKTEDLWHYSLSDNSPLNEFTDVDQLSLEFGIGPDDVPLVGDFDGDGKTDFAYWRKSDLTWYIRNSSKSNFNSELNDGIKKIAFGFDESDIPVPADYNGDGITDIAVYSSRNNQWYIKNSRGKDATGADAEFENLNLFGNTTDIPVSADFDGDGIVDVALRKPGVFRWVIRYSSTGKTANVKFASNKSDIPMIADYDGDGRADLAVYRGSSGLIIIRRSSDDAVVRVRSEQVGAIPVLSPLSTKLEFVENLEKDADGDGVSDYLETSVYFSDPDSADSDGDGLSDYEEIFEFQTNPMRADSDSDGIADIDEINVYGTDPSRSDSDDDGFDDAVEIEYGTNPNNEVNFGVPKATSRVVMRMNLPAEAIPLNPDNFNPDDSETYHASTSTKIYDGRGGEHIQTFYFLRDANARSYSPNEWLVVTSVDGVFYHFADRKGNIIYEGESNSPDNEMVTYIRNQSVGFGQKLPVPEHYIAGAGVKAFRLLFNSLGDLKRIRFADGEGLGPYRFGGIELPVTDYIQGFVSANGEASSQIEVDISLNREEKTDVEPTQFAQPFEMFFIAQDGHASEGTPESLTDDLDTVLNSFPTTLVHMHMNLPAHANSMDPGAFNPNDSGTFNESTSVTIYDSLGQQRTLTFYFLKLEGANEWLVTSAVDGLFCDFTGIDGAVGNKYSSSPLPNLVGKGQSIPIGEHPPYEFTLDGVWATRLVFDTYGDLVGVQDYEGKSFPGPTDFLEYPEVESVYPFYLNGAESIYGVGLNFNFEPLGISTIEPTQFASEFEMYSIKQNGLNSLGQSDNGIDPDYSGVLNPPALTTEVELDVNLPASDVSLDPALFNPSDSGTYNASTSINIYDSLGGVHTQHFYFLKDRDSLVGNEWLVVTSLDGEFYDFANSDGTDPADAISNGANVVGFGETLTTANDTISNTGVWAVRLTFSSDGDLTHITTPDGSFVTIAPHTIPLYGFADVGADASQSVSLNFNLDMSGASLLEPTQFASPFEVISISQNGHP